MKKSEQKSVVTENINDVKYREYQKNKIFKMVYIIGGLGVITLSVLALLQKISFVWGLVLYACVYIFNKFYLK